MNFNSTSATSSEITASFYHPEEALQSMCKQLLKSRLFRGYYEERRYVDPVNNYRDVIVLQRTEKDLERLLLEVKQKLLKFYRHVPNIWIGITNENLSVTKNHILSMCLWVELENIAFGQYWFCIKSVRFRCNEILLKLRMVRPVEMKTYSDSLLGKCFSLNSLLNGSAYSDPAECSSDLSVYTKDIKSTEVLPTQSKICLNDFIHLMNNCCVSIKRTLYDFMVRDITKDNIKILFKFLGLLIISIASVIMLGVKLLGIFVLRFLFEVSRLMHIMTPMILQIFEVLSKLIGGFYLILTIIWKDLIGNRLRERYELKQPALTFEGRLLPGLEYGKDYDINTNRTISTPSLTEFERKYQY